MKRDVFHLDLIWILFFILTLFFLASKQTLLSSKRAHVSDAIKKRKKKGQAAAAFAGDSEPACVSLRSQQATLAPGCRDEFALLHLPKVIRRAAEVASVHKTAFPHFPSPHRT